MKSFFWKFMICLVPCLLAGWSTTDATIKYYRGDSGGFKLGVDLVGGTILVYEIDLRKNQDTDNKFDPVRDINVLAESLKRRIDPNDLYNITIRPAGGEGRIEIILPTGGTHRAKKAEATWNSLLRALEKEFLPKEPAGTLAVGRGKILELADQIQTIESESIWKKQLFSDKDAWARLQANALLYWARIYNQIQGDPENKEKPIPPDLELKKRFEAIEPGDLPGFSKFVIATLEGTADATTEKTIKSWTKKQAWEETMTQIRLKWLGLKPWSASPEFQVGDVVLMGDKAYRADKKNQNDKPPSANWTALTPEQEPYRDDMSRITPDSNIQLTTFVLTKGQVIGQAALSLLDPLVGAHLQKVFDDGPSADEVHQFTKDHYGPPVQDIMKSINKHMSESGLGKDLSVEEVQRIKDLVKNVGSLEFRILANGTDDTAAIEDNIKLIKSGDTKAKEEFANAQQSGKAPPTFRAISQGEAKPKRYAIVTARGTQSKVTYSWVELGPQERRALNLDNAARADSTRNSAWHAANLKREKDAGPIPETAGNTDRFLLQGALFYSRECKDRNLPEEERRAKQFEYFILTRDPEFESLTSEVRTPKIDGSYLVNAYGQPGADLRPAVHFTFSNLGGELFGNITRKNVSEGTGPEGTQKRRHLAIILDGLVMSAPTINSEIRNQGQISGNFTQKEVDSLVNILRAGRLPATLKPQPVSESSIAATLGEDTIMDGVKAILLSFGAVLVFMCVYYRFAGIVASVALMANLLLTIGFMVAVQATFTLSGLAGIVLTLGMAVDANVLIYERLREERERGASLLQAIRNGYDRALPTIIDTHLSSIFTAIVLYVVGNDNLKGFAISMTVGLLISLFTSLFMTRFMFDFWQSKGWLTKLTMMRLFHKPDWDFMSIRYIMFAITLGLSILGLGLFIGRIPNDLNIDFIGGTAYGGKLTEGVTTSDLRGFVAEPEQKRLLTGVKAKQIDGDPRRYSLTFPNSEPREVSLSNIPIPDGTAQANEKNVEDRASMLREPSVELLYNTSKEQKIIDEMNAGLSRNFVIRTTEKEAELVQACLDQLLRTKEGTPLLKKVYAHVEPFDKRETKLKFYESKEDAQSAGKPNATASPSFVKSLLNRELRRTFASELKDDKSPLPFVFEVLPEGNSDSDGKYEAMKVAFGTELKTEHFPRVVAAIKEALKAFSARPLPDRLENFDSALANETRFRAMWAVLASWAAILMYLWFRFGNWTFGLAAVICLIHDLFFTLGAIAACYFVHGTIIGDALKLDDFKLDLPSVAALLTLVGYSVNDTIVVFDRIREVRGKNPDLTPKMINDSVNQTLSRTILSSLTVWLVVVVLYWTGGPGVHLFAFVMVVGVIVGTYSSIYIAAPLLLIFGEGKHEDTSPQGARLPTPTPVTAIKV